MAAAEKPNILVIWGNDIGITNLSCYSDGLMGYRPEGAAAKPVECGISLPAVHTDETTAAADVR